MPAVECRIDRSPGRGTGTRPKNPRPRAVRRSLRNPKWSHSMSRYGRRAGARLRRQHRPGPRDAIDARRRKGPNRDRRAGSPADASANRRTNEPPSDGPGTEPGKARRLALDVSSSRWSCEGNEARRLPARTDPVGGGRCLRGSVIHDPMWGAAARDRRGVRHETIADPGSIGQRPRLPSPWLVGDSDPARLQGADDCLGGVPAPAGRPGRDSALARELAGRESRRRDRSRLGNRGAGRGSSPPRRRDSRVAGIQAWADPRHSRVDHRRRWPTSVLHGSRGAHAQSHRVRPGPRPRGRWRDRDRPPFAAPFGRSLSVAPGTRARFGRSRSDASVAARSPACRHASPRPFARAMARSGSLRRGAGRAQSDHRLANRAPAVAWRGPGGRARAADRVEPHLLPAAALRPRSRAHRGQRDANPRGARRGDAAFSGRARGARTRTPAAWAPRR